MEFQENKFPFATELMPLLKFQEELINFFSEGVVALPISADGHLIEQNLVSCSSTSRYFHDQVCSDLVVPYQMPSVTGVSPYISAPSGLKDVSVNLFSPHTVSSSHDLVLPVSDPSSSVLPVSRQTPNMHPMITRAKDGISKPKAYVSTQSLLSEPQRYIQACKYSRKEGCYAIGI